MTGNQFLFSIVIKPINNCFEINYVKECIQSYLTKSKEYTEIDTIHVVVVSQTNTVYIQIFHSH